MKVTRRTIKDMASALFTTRMEANTQASGSKIKWKGGGHYTTKLEKSHIRETGKKTSCKDSEFYSMKRWLSWEMSLIIATYKICSLFG